MGLSESPIGMGLDRGAAREGQLGELGDLGTYETEAIYIGLRKGEDPPFEIEMFERQCCPFYYIAQFLCYFSETFPY